MYIDALGLLDDAHAYTATAFSTNTIDFGSSTPKRQVGDGEPMGIGVICDVAADFTTGDETYRFDVVQSANANLSAPDVISSSTRVAAVAVGAGQLFIGARFILPLTPGFPTKQFFGLQLTMGGTTPTITITAWFTLLKLFDKIQVYAKGYVGPG